MGKKKDIDWEFVEREYRAGQLSIRQIARQEGNVPDTSIRRAAKKNGWSRDLTQKVKNRIKSDLARSDSDSGVEEEIINDAAARGVQVVREHRSGIAAQRSLAMRLLDELDTATTHVGELEDMIAADTSGDKDNKRRQAMLRAVALPGRAGTLRDLSTILKNLITVERTAFNLNGSEGEAFDHEAALAELDD